jgi:hypothetical protein
MLSDDELRQIQNETGVDVFAIIDRLAKTPAERLRIASDSARNVVRLRRADPSDSSSNAAADGAFDPISMLRVLHEEDVTFVIVGGIARYLLGSDALPTDLDICYDRVDKNVSGLASALERMHALRRDQRRDLTAFVPEAALRDHEIVRLAVDFGFLDCFADWSNGELRSRAEAMMVSGIPVLVACVDDLMTMTSGSSRAKDRWVLETLRILKRIRH